MEYASIRLSSVWASASTAPPNIDSSATVSHTVACPLKIHGEASRSAANSPKVAMSTTDTISAVVIGAAADATAGSQKEKGIRPSFKAKPKITSQTTRVSIHGPGRAPPLPINASAISVQTIAGTIAKR